MSAEALNTIPCQLPLKHLALGLVGAVAQQQVPIRVHFRLRRQQQQWGKRKRSSGLVMLCSSAMACGATVLYLYERLVVVANLLQRVRASRQQGMDSLTRGGLDSDFGQR